jgi:ERCC4-related helicase
VTGTKNLPSLMAQVHPFYLQRGLSAFDHWLPDVRVQVVQLDLYPEQRRLNERIVAQMFPEQGEPVVYHTAASLNLARERAKADDPSSLPLLAKISALLYSQMAVDSPIVLGHPGIPSIKEDDLVRFLDEEVPGQQVAVFTRFEQVATVLVNRLTAERIPVVRITGKESAHEARQAQLTFQAGDARVCVITLAGSEAIDLHAASTLVFYDLPWSFGEFRQVIGRVRRKGSEHSSILVLVPMAKSTVDEHTFNILQQKENLVAATFSLDELHLDEAASDVDLRTEAVSGVALRCSSLTSEGFINDLFDKVRTTAYPPAE